jgi:magnesium-transporting ATPase (P-type)
MEVHVRRICDGHGSETFPVDEKSLVGGDIVLLSPGDGIPADSLIIESSNVSVSWLMYALEN